MEQIQSTYQDVIDFFNVANRYMQMNEEDSKFRYALSRTLKSAGRVVGDYQDKVQAINIKHCLAADDGKGEILRDQNGQFKFTKDGLTKSNEERAKLFRAPVKLEVHFATELPKKALTASERDSFIGFVIKEDKPPK